MKARNRHELSRRLMNTESSSVAAAEGLPQSVKLIQHFWHSTRLLVGPIVGAAAIGGLVCARCSRELQEHHTSPGDGLVTVGKHLPGGLYDLPRRSGEGSGLRAQVSLPLGNTSQVKFVTCLPEVARAHGSGFKAEGSGVV